MNLCTEAGVPELEREVLQEIYAVLHFMKRSRRMNNGRLCYGVDSDAEDFPHLHIRSPQKPERKPDHEDCDLLNGVAHFAYARLIPVRKSKPATFPEIPRGIPLAISGWNTTKDEGTLRRRR